MVSLTFFSLEDSYYPTFCYFTTVNHIFHWLNFVFVDYASILSLFTRCCLWRSVRVSYYRTEYFCCPGWKTSTYENCDVGKKIDRKEGNVRLWVVKVTYNNIAATSWQYVLFGGWCNTVSMVSYCTCSYQKIHPYDLPNGHWEV